MNKGKLAHTFNYSYRYIDNVLSLNNSRFGDYLHRIYPNEIEVKNTTYTQKSTSYLDIHLEINNGGRLKTKLYDNAMTSLFQQLTSSSSVAIFQHPHHLELPFHNSYVIVDIVSSTVIF
jgi:hypothetical protein